MSRQISDCASYQSSDFVDDSGVSVLPDGFPEDGVGGEVVGEIRGTDTDFEFAEFIPFDHELGVEEATDVDGGAGAVLAEGLGADGRREGEGEEGGVYETHGDKVRMGRIGSSTQKRCSTRDKKKECRKGKCALYGVRREPGTRGGAEMR